MKKAFIYLIAALFGSVATTAILGGRNVLEALGVVFIGMTLYIGFLSLSDDDKK